MSGRSVAVGRDNVGGARAQVTGSELYGFGLVRLYSWMKVISITLFSAFMF